MKNILIRIKSFIVSHKVWTIIIALALAGGIWMYVRANAPEEKPSYVFAEVKRETIVASISGTGQVSASNQVDVVTKTAGELVYLNAKTGQTVRAGAAIGQIDAGDAGFELETAKLSYEELVSVDEDELSDAQDAVIDAETDLKDAYVSARATLASAVTDMNDIMADLDSLFDGYLNTNSRFGMSKTEKEYIDRAESSFYATDDILDDFSKEYRTVSNDTENETIESMLTEANKIANNVAQATKYTKDAVVYLRDREDDASTEADDAYTTANELVTTANSAVSDTLSVKNSLTKTKRELKNAHDDLEDIMSGPKELDIRSEELSVRQKEEAYADHFIRAPFDGIIASVSAQKGDNLSNGANVATLITRQKIAEISLNEIDAAKVKLGNKATLSFDAAEDLSIAGEVLEIDLLGTVSQGVVSYNVKIGFDTEDDRVKPGMTVSATIITDTREDVLAISAGAIKTQGEMTYVETKDGEMIRRIPITVGLSDDELTEVLSGLEEGQSYIARTVNTGNAPVQTPSLFPSGGGNRMRIGG